MNTNLNSVYYYSGSFHIYDTVIGIGVVVACVFLFILLRKRKKNSS
jgi:ABC-type multidrug transport system permease subunit